MTFQEIYVNSFNRFAHAASTVVAEAPNAAYNPLVLYGGTGTGKTMLLRAIEDTVKAEHPDCAVRRVTAAALLEELVEVLQNGHVEALTERYMENDYVLIDSLEILCGKDATTAYVLTLAKQLASSGKQVVLSLNSGADDAFRKQLLRGLRFDNELPLIADIQPPSEEERLEFTQQYVKRYKLPLTEAICTLIAAHTATLPQIIGAVTTLSAHRELLCEAPPLAAVIKALTDRNVK